MTLDATTGAFVGAVLVTLVLVVWVLMRASAELDEDLAALPLWDPFAPPPAPRPRMHEPCRCASPGLAPMTPAQSADLGKRLADLGRVGLTARDLATTYSGGTVTRPFTAAGTWTRPKTTSTHASTFATAIDIAHRRAVHTGLRHCVHREPDGRWFVHLAHPPARRTSR